MKRNVFRGKLILITAIIITIIDLGGYYYYYQKQNQVKHATTPEDIVTIVPKANIAPIRIDYKSGDQVKNYKFFLNYPAGWSVSLNEDPNIRQYGKDNTFKNRINFYLIPPNVTLNHEENFWGGFDVDVYDVVYPSIEDWLKNFLTLFSGSNGQAWKQRSSYVYTTLKLRDKTIYYIDSNENAPDYIRAGFAPRYVVLGTYYTYIIGFFQNGELGSHERIKADIIPRLQFD